MNKLTLDSFPPTDFVGRRCRLTKIVGRSKTTIILDGVLQSAELLPVDRTGEPQWFLLFEGSMSEWLAETEDGWSARLETVD